MLTRDIKKSYTEYDMYTYNQVKWMLVKHQNLVFIPFMYTLGWSLLNQISNFLLSYPQSVTSSITTRYHI